MAIGTIVVFVDVAVMRLNVLLYSSVTSEASSTIPKMYQNNKFVSYNGKTIRRILMYELVQTRRR